MRYKTKKLSTYYHGDFPLISVIIPVFNVESYLATCVNSILDQTYNNIEVLLIDDGSSDNSGEICDNFQKKDHRITVCHVINGGVSQARNIGISKSSGEYIAFVDSDDYVRPEYLQKLLNMCSEEDVDIVTCGRLKIQNVHSNLNHNYITNSIVRDSFDATLDLLYQRNIQNSVWGKLYNRRSIGDLRFNTNIHIAEDLEFNYYVFKNIEKLVHISTDLYYYRTRDGSAMKSAFNSSRVTGITAIEGICSDSKAVSKQQYCAAQNRLFIESAQLLTIIPASQKKYIKLCYDNVKKCRRTVITDNNSIVKYRLYAVLSYLGVRALTFILSIKNRFWRKQNG